MLLLPNEEGRLEASHPLEVDRLPWRSIPFLRGKAFFLSAILSSTVSSSGPKSKSPEKGIPHSLTFDAKSLDHVLSHIARLAGLMVWLG